MITLQSGETDKIIVTDTTSNSPEEIVGEIHVTWYDLNYIVLGNRRIFIKRNMLGTSIEVSASTEEILGFVANIYSFSITPTTIEVTQAGYNILSIQIPTEVLEENIELEFTVEIG